IDPAGNIAVTGSFSGSIDFGGGPVSYGSLAGFLVKLSPAGAHIWSKRTAPDVALAIDPWGNIIVADSGMEKYSPPGALLWSHWWAGTVLRAVATSKNGDIAATGVLVTAQNFGNGLLQTAGYDDVLLFLLGP